ncbi:hypothetical protein N7466_003963 [Penicillium verhagenii]|uniref:uncharacterized protein n=1 Tax=Penicillium verhagenii TaxID=1562060 RepID=UPI00254529D9|nr:uncharacterized protein N7466_003963 [Penicillium verhagenii]KAJ5934416.1 hypothetical protein N7466_003963 [Penicillium verhagenii]
MAFFFGAVAPGPQSSNAYPSRTGFETIPVRHACHAPSVLFAKDDLQKWVTIIALVTTSLGAVVHLCVLLGYLYKLRKNRKEKALVKRVRALEIRMSKVDGELDSPSTWSTRAFRASGIELQQYGDDTLPVHRGQAQI